MNPRSAKNKGNRFENHLVAELRKAGIKAQRTYGSGAGLDKNDIRLPDYEIEIEAKNQKTIKLIDWWEQKNRQTLGNNVGILALRNPKQPEFQETLVCVELTDFIRILGSNRESGKTSRYGSVPTGAKYQIQRTREELRKLDKVFDEYI